MTRLILLENGGLRLVRESGEVIILTRQEREVIAATQPVTSMVRDHLAQHQAYSADELRRAGII